MVKERGGEEVKATETSRVPVKILESEIYLCFLTFLTSPKSEQTRIIEDVFKASIRCERNPHNIITNLDRNDAKQIKTIKDGLHNVIFRLVAKFATNLDVESFSKMHFG